MDMNCLRNANVDTKRRDVWATDQVEEGRSAQVDILITVKSNTLRWFGHDELMESGNLTGGYL